MGSIKNEYINCLRERKDILNQIKTLEENEIVKQYFELIKQNNELTEKEKVLYKKAKIEEYSTCKHILIFIQRETDFHEGRTTYYYACPKCGLDEWYANENYRYEEEAKMMLDFLITHRFKGVEFDFPCNFDDARNEYKKLKEVHPDLNEEELNEVLKERLINLKKEKNAEEKSEQANTKDINEGKQKTKIRTK